MTLRDLHATAKCFMLLHASYLLLDIVFHCSLVFCPTLIMCPFLFVIFIGFDMLLWGFFPPLVNLVPLTLSLYTSFCFLHAAGARGHSFLTHQSPSQLLPRALFSLAGNIFHRSDGHVILARNQGTKSTAK